MTQEIVSSKELIENWQQIKKDLDQVTDQLIQLSAFLTMKKNELSSHEQQLAQELAERILKNVSKLAQ
ncbi:hypothetical protein [Undibacterium sp. RuRC25W]|uniref:hypothetical protein n=1 Tax=Undibacterium sp. RuRC25W TaxID=3413047 RepID=UPI003BF243CB